MEGEFGTGKRKYGLNLLMTKLKETSETIIVLNFLLMNIEKKLRLLLRQNFYGFYLSKLHGFAVLNS